MSYNPGDKSRAICSFCGKIQPTTFKLRTLSFRSDPNMTVKDALCAVCDVCDKVIGTLTPKTNIGKIEDFTPWNYSGVCLCGHSYSDHHCCCVMNPVAAMIMSSIVPDTCCYFGCNEFEGVDENGNDHCWGYVDALNPNEELKAKWKGTKR
jgi:hypothetical protein